MTVAAIPSLHLSLVVPAYALVAGADGGENETVRFWRHIVNTEEKLRREWRPDVGSPDDAEVPKRYIRGIQHPRNNTSSKLHAAVRMGFSGSHRHRKVSAAAESMAMPYEDLERVGGRRKNGAVAERQPTMAQPAHELHWPHFEHGAMRLMPRVRRSRPVPWGPPAPSPPDGDAATLSAPAVPGRDTPTTRRAASTEPSLLDPFDDDCSTAVGRKSPALGRSPASSMPPKSARVPLGRVAAVAAVAGGRVPQSARGASAPRAGSPTSTWSMSTPISSARAAPCGGTVVGGKWAKYVTAG
eukprot:CAMPEP_0170279500 /NCGR_PEP_ID=MMETSP0116_2-20130129/39761_1 /TAXON_ID=400756 /ORGANISM="Durinskia baltica, Strain CSIRO CS-38" /LENGTH=298 /DNA_ID=CAMNT_0010530825 /DNA_START=107 /DNA_END=1000 /DNA_ORIENTATION=-